jgi:hypothetical protein
VPRNAEVERGVSEKETSDINNKIALVKILPTVALNTEIRYPNFQVRHPRCVQHSIEYV